MCAAFVEYEKVPETVPLDSTEDNVTWVASKLSCAAGVLGVEAIKIRNWLICFRCAPEELRVIVASMADSVANYPPPLGRLFHTYFLSPSSSG